MEPDSLAASLADIRTRRAGSDAERRASALVFGELRAAGAQPELRTHWTRPDRPVARTLIAVLGAIGSGVAVASPAAGGAVAAAALALLGAEAAFGWSPIRLLTPRRATQDVVLRAGPEPVAWRIAAPLDLRRRDVPSWLLAVAILLVIAAAVARQQGAEGNGIGVAQLVPTLMLLASIAWLLEAVLGTDRGLRGEGEADLTRPAAVATALAAVLADTPPRRSGVEIVLAGATDGRPRRGALTDRNTRWLTPEDVQDSESALEQLLAEVDSRDAHAGTTPG